MYVIHKSDMWKVIKINYTKWMLHKMDSVNFLLLDVNAKCAKSVFLNHWITSHWFDFIRLVGHGVFKVMSYIND